MHAMGDARLVGLSLEAGAVDVLRPPLGATHDPGGPHGEFAARVYWLLQMARSGVAVSRARRSNQCRPVNAAWAHSTNGTPSARATGPKAASAHGEWHNTTAGKWAGTVWASRRRAPSTVHGRRNRTSPSIPTCAPAPRSSPASRPS